MRGADYMIRTLVCKQEGCCGNEFFIETIDDKLQAICKECGREYVFDVCYNDYVMISSCSQCKNDSFKLFRDIENNRVYAKCTKCGATPEMIYLDSDGVQVSYEAKLLQDIREIMSQVDQRICNLELKVETMEHGQEILEESLAYINRYIVQQH